MAGDALLTLAFGLLGEADSLGDPFVRCELVTRLAQAAGPSYRGRVVFPHAGTWNLTFDPGVPGFPVR